MIDINYDKTVTIKRLFDEESDMIEEYATHIENLPCHIQPLDDSYTQDLDGNFGKEWLMFCRWDDILEGDRVVCDDIEYRVVGTERHNFLGKRRHMEIRLRRSLS